MRTFKWFVFFISCSFVSDTFAQRYKEVIYERIDTLSDVSFHRSVGLSGQLVYLSCKTTNKTHQQNKTQTQ